MDSHAAAIARIAAFSAADPLLELVHAIAHPLQRFAQLTRRIIGLAALGADLSHQPLGENHVQSRADEVRLDAHVHQAGNGGRGIVGVQRAEDEMAGQRGLDCGPGGFVVADFADHDHVGILAKQRAEGLRERQPHLLLHLELVDQRQMVLNRVFDGADVVLHRGDFIQRRVESGRFSAAGRSGHQDDAVGRLDAGLELRQNVLRKSQVAEVERDTAGIQHPDHGLFATVAGESADAEIDLAAVEHHIHPPILGQAALADVQARHDLDAAGDGTNQVQGNFQRLVELAVDAVADARAALRGLNVNVARPFADGVVDHVIDQADDRRLPRHVGRGVGDVRDRLDEGHVPLLVSIDNVVDDERLAVRQRGDHPPDVLGRRRDDLDFQAGQAADFVDQKEVRRLGDRNGERAADAKQREDQIFLDIFPRQDVDDPGVGDAGFQLGERNAIDAGQALGDMVLGAVLQVDEDFAKEFAVSLLLLELQGGLQLVHGDITSFHEDISEPLWSPLAAHRCSNDEIRMANGEWRKVRRVALSFVIRHSNFAILSPTQSSSPLRARSRKLRAADRAA